MKQALAFVAIAFLFGMAIYVLLTNWSALSFIFGAGS